MFPFFRYTLNAKIVVKCKESSMFLWLLHAVLTLVHERWGWQMMLFIWKAKNGRNTEHEVFYGQKLLKWNCNQIILWMEMRLKHLCRKVPRSPDGLPLEHETLTVFCPASGQALPAADQGRWFFPSTQHWWGCTCVQFWALLYERDMKSWPKNWSISPGIKSEGLDLFSISLFSSGEILINVYQYL